MTHHSSYPAFAGHRLLLAWTLALFAAGVFAQPNDTFTRQPPRSASQLKAEAKVAPAVSGKRAATPLPANFSSLDAQATVAAGSKTVQVGEIRKAISAELARLSAPAKTVKVARAGAPSVVAAAPRTMATQSRSPVIGKNVQTPVAHSPFITSSAQARKTDDLRKLACTHNGPPELTDTSGAIAPGARITLSGYCFGERMGRVEIIGQFPGGALRPTFVSWQTTAIELTIPADVRGAGDHVVAITVIASDGRPSPALQGRFVAARDRVAVPADRWLPGATQEMMSVEDVSWTSNRAFAGTAERTVRIHRECRLTDMVTTVIAGVVDRIDGFDAGPPHEATVRIAWHGACTGSTVRTQYDYFLVALGDDISFKSACRIAFEAKATADCPAGVAP